MLSNVTRDNYKEVRELSFSLSFTLSFGFQTFIQYFVFFINSSAERSIVSNTNAGISILQGQLPRSLQYICNTFSVNDYRIDTSIHILAKYFNPASTSLINESSWSNEKRRISTSSISLFYITSNFIMVFCKMLRAVPRVRRCSIW